ncbi:hypothetical protein [Clostridium sp.]|uniref:hypothetical protein n=1 Tax=Clostridium sp. TaxID=1506 RepID=UPI001A391879|nr:hypothetical protein [Clostridium sp.]MBK5239855.1 hypothetical protein [Clostridium sp.]
MAVVVEYEDGCKIINRYKDYTPQEANKAHEKILSELYKLFSKRDDSIDTRIK